MAEKAKVLSGREPIDDQFWDYDEKGIRKYNPRKAAQCILEGTPMITIGEIKKTIYRYDRGVYRDDGRSFIETTIQKLTGGHVRQNQVNETIFQIERATHAERSILDSAPPNLVCVSNGILNIVTGQLRQHDPQVVFLQRIPHPYNPASECPKVIEFMETVLPKGFVPMIQQWVGYLLYRRYAIKRAVILIGEADTGKTSMLRLMVALVGQENTSSVSLHELVADDFSAYWLFGKLLNHYDDLAGADLQSTASFKMATGAGYLSAEKKFAEKFFFQNFAKLTFCTNMVPPVKKPDDAYYSRWMPIFFNHIFVEKDDGYIDRIINDPQEMEGFLAWAVEGLQSLLKQGAFTYPYPPEEVRRLMERSGSTVAGFAQDCLGQDAGKVVKRDLMYAAYQAWTLANGGAVVSPAKFGRLLPEVCPYIQRGDTRKDSTEKRSEHVWMNVQISVDDTANTAFQEIISYININNKLFNYPFQDNGLEKWGITRIWELISIFLESEQTPGNSVSETALVAHLIHAGIGTEEAIKAIDLALSSGNIFRAGGGYRSSCGAPP